MTERHEFVPGPDPMLCADCGHPRSSTVNGPDFYHVVRRSGRIEKGSAQARMTTPDRLREAADAIVLAVAWRDNDDASDGLMIVDATLVEALAAALAEPAPAAPLDRSTWPASPDPATCGHDALIDGDDNCPDCGAPVIYRPAPAAPLDRERLARAYHEVAEESAFYGLTDREFADAIANAYEAEP